MKLIDYFFDCVFGLLCDSLLSSPSKTISSADPETIVPVSFSLIFSIFSVSNRFTFGSSSASLSLSFLDFLDFLPFGVVPSRHSC